MIKLGVRGTIVLSWALLPIACGGSVGNSDDGSAACLTTASCIQSETLSTAGLASIEAQCTGTLVSACPTVNVLGVCANAFGTITFYAVAGASAAASKQVCTTQEKGTWSSE
jgi:hypothetical protein